MDCYYSDYTSNGKDVALEVNAETVEVTYDNCVHFYFSPDFPQDAKAFFEALCTVKEVVIDG